ncbi:unknown [Prevotella sp. CAG:1092]|nr:unknown [Prevotella sp. CAG:1092]
MRHFYTTMLAAMVATTSFAQSTVKTQSLLEANTVGTVTTCPIKQQSKVLPFGAKKTNFRLPNFAKKTTKSLAKRVKNNAVDTPLITEQPAGTLHANYYGE